MKKLVVLSFLMIIGSVQADVASKIDRAVDTYGAKAGDAIQQKVDKAVNDKVVKPLEQKTKEMEKVRDEQKKLLEKNAEDAVKRAALALWSKIKGWFGK